MKPSSRGTQEARSFFVRLIDTERGPGLTNRSASADVAPGVHWLSEHPRLKTYLRRDFWNIRSDLSEAAVAALAAAFASAAACWAAAAAERAS